tara:strand:- start:1861 stop:2010 length:150 start_codon:yes stop_codon:yes gene_type:complete
VYSLFKKGKISLKENLFEIRNLIETNEKLFDDIMKDINRYLRYHKIGIQ